MGAIGGFPRPASPLFERRQNILNKSPWKDASSRRNHFLGDFQSPKSVGSTRAAGRGTVNPKGTQGNRLVRLRSCEGVSNSRKIHPVFKKPPWNTPQGGGISGHSYLAMCMSPWGTRGSPKKSHFPTWYSRGGPPVPPPRA